MAPPWAINDMADLKRAAIRLGTEGPHKTLPTPRLVQLLHNGAYLIKTTKAIFVWEHPYYPQLYISASELDSYVRERAASLQITPGEEFKSPDGKVVATQLTLTVRGKSIEKACKFTDDLSGKAGELAGLVKIVFSEVDKWFEESTPIFVHPKDPFKRVDILQSTRHIVVRIGGQVIADTRTSMHLYETGLPCRYYLPLTCVDAGALRRSKTRTACPYKGEAEYYSVVLEDGKVVEDVVWYYDRPLLECAKIEGLVCFYNEKVQIEIDGENLESPVTHFSRAIAPEEKPTVVIKKEES